MIARLFQPCPAGLVTAAVVLWAVPAAAQMQSSLHAAGPAAERIAELWWIMVIGAAIILALVMVLVGVALIAQPALPRASTIIFVHIGGVAFPFVVLSALLIYTLDIGRDLAASPPSNSVKVEVVARQWWWEIRYPDQDGVAGFTTANELHIPIGRPVEVIVSSPDVIHSFWVPNLAGKIDAIPGRINRLVLRADRPGIYRGQCAEYCGLQHALMAFHVIAETPESYAAWLERQHAPVGRPAVPILARGRDLFIESGCGACHTVRGTEAAGRSGPDLTHVGSRQALAAGTLPNGVGSLAGWIADADHIKRGNGMPSFNVLAGEDLRALAAWLDSLQ